MTNLNSIIELTWRDFRDFYKKNFRFRYERERFESCMKMYGIFTKEADIRFHFARILWQKLQENNIEKDYAIFLDYSLNPSDYDPKYYVDNMPKRYEGWKEKIEKILSNLQKKSINIDLVVSKLDSTLFGDILIEFKYFRSVKKYDRLYLEINVDGFKDDLKRLKVMRTHRLCNVGLCVVVDEIFFDDEDIYYPEHKETIEKQKRRIESLLDRYKDMIRYLKVSGEDKKSWYKDVPKVPSKKQ